MFMRMKIYSVEPSGELAEEQTDPVDKVALETKLIDIETAGLNEADYTETSWQILKDEVIAVQAIFSDDEATQDAVDESLETLTATYDGLKVAEDQAEKKAPTVADTAEDESEKDEEANASKQDEVTNDEQESKANETDNEDEA